MTFVAYGTASCVYTSGTYNTDPCSDGGSDVTPTTETPQPGATSGTTLIGWWLGNLDADTNGARKITLTYSVYPSETYENDTAVVAGNSLDNGIAAYWQSTATNGGPAWTASTDVPSPTTFSLHSSTASSDVTVLAPSLSVSKTRSVANPTPGETVTYTVTVSNASTNSATAYLTTMTDPIQPSRGLGDFGLEPERQWELLLANRRVSR